MRSRLKARLSEDGPLLLLVIATVVIGIWLRVVSVGFPRHLTWDEHHFVENARNYLQHRHDWNDHPPLGKLVMVPWMTALGDSSLSWRLSPLVFGVVSIGLAYRIASRLFRDRRAGYLAAAFVAGDGFLIAYSRTALLDGMLTTLVLATLCAAVRARGVLGAILVGFFIGLAANVKLSGFGLGVPVALVLLWREDRIVSWRALLSLLGLLTAPVVFTALTAFGLYLAREPHGVLDVWKETFRLLAQHYGAQTFAHPLSSHWYTWALPTRPITLRYDAAGPGTVRALTTLGNLVLYWSASVAFVVGLGVSVVSAWRVIRSRSRRLRLGRVTRATALVCVVALAMLLPWIVGKRDSYIYHYLPSYGCLLVLLGGVVATIYRRKRLLALGYAAAVFLVTVFYAPVWGQLPVGKAAFAARLFVPRWR